MGGSKHWQGSGNHTTQLKNTKPQAIKPCGFFIPFESSILKSI
jgi:hypothetical protein